MPNVLHRRIYEGNLDYDTSEVGRYFEPSRQLPNHIRATAATAKD